MAEMVINFAATNVQIMLEIEFQSLPETQHHRPTSFFTDITGSSQKHEIGRKRFEIVCFTYGSANQHFQKH